METPNKYGAYVIFSEKTQNESEMLKLLLTCVSRYNEDSLQTQDDIIILRKCVDKDSVDTKRWHMCMKKELIDDLRTKGKENGLDVRSYRPNTKPIGNGKTYAFYIPYKTEDEKSLAVSTLASLDGKFIRNGTCHVHEPSLREDGSDRGYILVSFTKNGDFFPRPFIRTLRALLNDLPLPDGRNLSVKWCSHRVLEDVISSQK